MRREKKLDYFWFNFYCRYLLGDINAKVRLKRIFSGSGDIIALRVIFLGAAFGQKKLFSGAKTEIFSESP